MVARMWTGAGILLCILILVYLSIIARRAVDEELEDDEPMTIPEDSEERMAFLAPEASNDLERGRSMAESPFRTHHLVSVETELGRDERWS